MSRKLIVAVLALAALFGTPLSEAKNEWVEVRSPNFVVVSNAGEKQARKTAIHFEQIRAVFRRSLRVASEHPTPVITILAAKDEGTMKSLLPEYWAKGHAHPAGIFVDRDNQYFAAVQLNVEGMNPYHTIFHEYYHSLTLPYYPNLPLWVAEGLADFWGNTEINDSDVEMGRPDETLVLELRQNKLIPLDVLFKVDHNSPYYNEQEKTSIFYAESWALTHYLMIGDKASHRPMLAAYLDAISQGSTPEQAAAKGFGDLKRLQAALEAYIRSNSFYMLKSGAPPTIAEADLHARELSDAEAASYRGGFEAVRGEAKEAIPILEQAVKSDPKLALGYQYLGYAEYTARQPKEALADLSRAIELEPNNAVTRFLRARLYAMTGEGDSSKIQADLRAAIAANPDFAPAYAVLAVYLASSNENLPEALTFAKKAASLQPGNSTYQFDMAEVLQAMHRIGDARKMAEAARTNALGPEQRRQAEALLTRLQQETDTPSAERETGDRTAESKGPPISSGVSSRISTTSSASPAPAVKPAEAASASNLKEATGVVTKVSCTNGVKMEMKTDAGVLHLAIKSGTQIRIEMEGPSQGQFNPCTSLPGQRATVEYEPDNAKGTSGNLAKIRVLNDTSVRRVTIAPGSKSGVASTAEGNVKDVNCTGSELTMTLDAKDGYFTLHAKDATRVHYEKDVAFDAGDFQACTQLAGHQVTVTFVPVDGQKYDGEIQAVEITK